MNPDGADVITDVAQKTIPDILFRSSVDEASDDLMGVDPAMPGAGAGLGTQPAITAAIQ